MSKYTKLDRVEKLQTQNNVEKLGTRYKVEIANVHSIRSPERNTKRLARKYSYGNLLVINRELGPHSQTKESDGNWKAQ